VKIILATNIAESSITIPDVDFGMLSEVVNDRCKKLCAVEFSTELTLLQNCFFHLKLKLMFKQLYFAWPQFFSYYMLMVALKHAAKHADVTISLQIIIGP